MELTSWAAAWFLPFTLPICLYIAWTDMKAMKIPNHAVVALAVVFAVIGLIALPFEIYLWRFSHLAVVLLIGIILNAAGLIGAGDAKFCAAAAPFVAVQDLPELAVIFAAVLLVAWLTHRLAKHTALRALAPDWESWTKRKKFPMGLALGPTLTIYLLFGILNAA